MSNDKSNASNPFIRNQIFEEPALAFARREKIDEAVSDCLVFVDTNVLLDPYRLNVKRLRQIKALFEPLKDANRLFLPAQVAREFAAIRSTKISDLYSSLTLPKWAGLPNYEILSDLDEFKKLKEIDEEIEKLEGEYKTVFNKLRQKVRGLESNDPVNQMYSDLFNAENIVELDAIESIETQNKIREEFENRKQHKWPPGFKDSDNEFGGIGDFLIWLTIVQKCQNEEKHCIFVTGDEKNDWRVRSNNTPLHARLELIIEFMTKTCGKSFYMYNFADFSKLFKADAKLVQDLEGLEAQPAKVLPLNDIPDNTDNPGSARIIYEWEKIKKWIDDYLWLNHEPSQKMTMADRFFRLVELEVIDKSFCRILEALYGNSELYLNHGEFAGFDLKKHIDDVIWIGEHLQGNINLAYSRLGN